MIFTCIFVKLIDCKNSDTLTRHVDHQAKTPVLNFDMIQVIYYNCVDHFDQWFVTPGKDHYFNMDCVGKWAIPDVRGTPTKHS